MDPSATDTTAAELPVNEDAAQREAAIRRREIILKIEEHATGLNRTTGAAYRYIAEMVNATPGEWEWIKTYIAEHPEVLNLPYHTPTQWDDIHRTRGNEALHNARTADASGNHIAALDHLDEARARGVIAHAGWRTGHDYLYNQGQAAPETTRLSTGSNEPSTATDMFADDALHARTTHVRERQLLLAITQRGPSVRGTDADWLRHVAVVVNATDEEREWMTAQVGANPGLLDGAHLGDGRISEINRKAARRAFAAATDAINTADYIAALDRLDDAEVHWPAGHPDRGETWDRYRTVVFERASSAENSNGLRSSSERGTAKTPTANDSSTGSSGLTQASQTTRAGHGPAVKGQVVGDPGGSAVTRRSSTRSR